MTNQLTPRIHGFGIVANSQAPTVEPIARKAATPITAPKRPAREFDKTSPFFYPCWVQGETETRLGYVVVLSYPTCTVNVPGAGVVEANLKNLKFITDVPGRNAAYTELSGSGQEPCAAMIVVGANEKGKAA